MVMVNPIVCTYVWHKILLQTSNTPVAGANNEAVSKPFQEWCALHSVFAVLKFILTTVNSWYQYMHTCIH